MAVSPYLIRFMQLPIGQHEFDFRIDDTFFKDREGSIIQQAAVDVKVIFHKTASAMSLDLSMDGDVAVECVRCLESFRMPIEMEKSLLVRLVDQPTAEEDDDDTVFVAKTANELDLSKTIYDFLTLEVPYSPVHANLENGEDGCDPEVLKHIKKAAPNASSSEEQPDEDGRWSELKKIKLN